MGGADEKGSGIQGLPDKGKGTLSGNCDLLFTNRARGVTRSYPRQTFSVAEIDLPTQPPHLLK